MKQELAVSLFYSGKEEVILSKDSGYYPQHNVSSSHHRAFTDPPLRTTEAFPCPEFQAEHFQALENISEVICFVRQRYQGSLRA